MSEKRLDLAMDALVWGVVFPPCYVCAVLLGEMASVTANWASKLS